MPETIFSLNLTAAQIDILARGIGKLTLEEGLATWLEIKAQVTKKQMEDLANSSAASVAGQSTANLTETGAKAAEAPEAAKPHLAKR